MDSKGVTKMLYTTLTLASSHVCGLLPHQLLLDIETTGLSKQSDTIVCIGLLTAKDDTCYYHAWFCESPLDEPLVVQAFLDFLSVDSKLYTFGGTHFDLAFIREKALCYDLNTALFDTLPKADIKRSPFYKTVFPGYTREDVENFLHFERLSSIKGRELVKVALLYFQTKDTRYHTLLTNHQKDELLSLAAMLTFYSLLAVLHHTPQALPYTRFPTHLALQLKASVLWPYAFALQLGYYGLSYEPANGLLVITIASEHKALKHFLPAKDYYIVGGELMHRSVAQFIPPALKTKATKQSAYITQTQDCFPSPVPHVKWVDEQGAPYLLAEEIDTHILLYRKDLQKKITLGLDKT